MVHDFNKFPELTDEQLPDYYFQSPHKQIFENFHAVCVKVHDGDTITLRWTERNFDFPIRFANIAAPELDEIAGQDSKVWLEDLLLGKDVDISIDKENRVEKWGRLVGNVYLNGVNVGLQEVTAGHAVMWEDRHMFSLPDFEKELKGAMKDVRAF